MVADGEEGERQQIKRHEKGGKVLLAVTVAVLKEIAAGLEGVERLILDPRNKMLSGLAAETLDILSVVQHRETGEIR